MKRITALVFITLMVFSSCENESNEPQIKDLSQESEFLNDMMTSTLNQTTSDLGSIIEISNNSVLFDSKTTVESSLTFINSNYFGNHFLDFNTITEGLDIKNLRELSNARLADQEYQLPEHFNQTQIDLVSSFFDEFVEQNLPEDVINLASKYRTIVQDASLGEEQSLEVLAFVEYADATAKLLSNPEFVQQFEELLSQATNGRIVRIQDFSWKSVWRGAVVGAGIGAVRGAIIGGTGGTVALPGVGTVTGAVGGAVFGGTAGFVEGAVAGIIVELAFD